MKKEKSISKGYMIYDSIIILEMTKLQKWKSINVCQALRRENGQKRDWCNYNRQHEETCGYGNIFGFVYVNINFLVIMSYSLAIL